MEVQLFRKRAHRTGNRGTGTAPPEPVEPEVGTGTGGAGTGTGGGTGVSGPPGGRKVPYRHPN